MIFTQEQRRCSRPWDGSVFQRGPPTAAGDGVMVGRGSAGEVPPGHPLAPAAGRSHLELPGTEKPPAGREVCSQRCNVAGALPCPRWPAA